MKAFTFISMLTLNILSTGCQSFQFVDSPIPVTSSTTLVNDNNE